MKRRGLLLLALASACKKASFQCTDVTGLTPDEITARTTLQYGDAAPDPNRTCEKCQQFVPSEGCGTCKLLKGPIHPRGTCKAFALRT
jgi:hypothetical protein